MPAQQRNERNRITLLRAISERLARKTSRRGFLGRATDSAFGLLIGAATGTAFTNKRAAAGSSSTVCFFPGPPCPCDKCLANGTCAKPCVIFTVLYASGCWVTAGVTCCDCTCQGLSGTGHCGCGTDWHNNANNCPNGNAG